MNDDNLSRRGAIMINRETLHARQMRRAAAKKLRVRHLPARANPRSSPFGLAWRAATEQNRLWKPASGESRFNGDVRPGDNLFTASVVALNPDTGKLAWYYQFTPHDTHDWDANQT